MDRTLPHLRRLLLALVLFGAMGLVVELLLLEHFEVLPQRIPLVLLGLTGATALGVLVRPGRGTLNAFRGVMALAVIAGAAGAWFHYRSNAQLEREIDPAIAGFELLRAAATGGVPTLAPGAMIQLGLLGLLAVWRHPGRSE